MGCTVVVVDDDADGDDDSGVSAEMLDTGWLACWLISVGPSVGIRTPLDLSLCCEKAIRLLVVVVLVVVVLCRKHPDYSTPT